MDKRFWSIVGVIILIFAGILVFHKSSSPTSSANPTNHVEGNLSSKVTLVEYGDYQCPVCESYYTTVKAVQQKYNDTVKFQFRNLPIPQIHPNGIAGARAAEAADLQGKFWQMHDALYDQQNYDEWAYDPAAQTVRSADPLPFFKAYAKAIGLNVTKFEKDYASSAVNDRINADEAAFSKTKQSVGTPSFFINGKFYANSNFVDSSGQPSIDAFSNILDTALKSAK